VLLDRASKTTRQVEASYMIAADGARSSVRDRLGIRMIGPDDLADYERVEFLAPLADAVGDRRYALYVITRPDAAGVLAPRGRGDRWGLSRERTPHDARLADLRDDELVALLARATGVDDLRPRVERLSSFAFAAQIAERYQQGRAFLVGDAAHRMTPRGGTGMNTAIQDSFDLGWKLGWVLRGWASSDLLRSYEEERRPVALHNIGRAGDPGGARSTTDEALPWDLNGRIAHHWLARGDQAVSTIDLIADGVTLLVGPDDPRWTRSSMNVGVSAPIAAHVLDRATVVALELEPSGAMLVRPDGREIRRWPRFDDVERPSVEDHATVPAWLRHPRSHWGRRQDENSC
jgi:putative polyketide hydroxylase